MMMRHTLLIGLLCAATACGAPSVNLATGVAVENLSTGWLDSGAVNGANKVVPELSFTLKNVSGQKLPPLQVNAVFRRISRTEEWGNGFRALSGSGSLAPGASTDTVAIDAPLGYTGTDPTESLLHNSQFVDAKVDLFARYGSATWTHLGEYPIERKMIERR